MIGSFLRLRDAKSGMLHHCKSYRYTYEGKYIQVYMTRAASILRSRSLPIPSLQESQFFAMVVGGFEMSQKQAVALRDSGGGQTIYRKNEGEADSPQKQSRHADTRGMLLRLL